MKLMILRMQIMSYNYILVVGQAEVHFENPFTVNVNSSCMVSLSGGRHPLFWWLRWTAVSRPVVVSTGMTGSH